MSIETLQFPLELKQFNDEDGFIQAYVTTYGNVDRVGDVIAPGALDNFIRNFTGQLPMLLNHQQLQLPIGEWTEFMSDARGVLGTGRLFTDTQLGADTRTIIRRGLYGSVSIGFQVIAFEPLDNGGRLFTDITLREVSVVGTPANPQAVITEIRQDDGSIDIRALEKLLRDAGCSRNEAKTLLSSYLTKLRDAESVSKTEIMASQLLATLNKEKSK